MKKYLFIILIVGGWFYSHLAFAADVYFSQSQSNGYLYYEYIPSIRDGHTFQADGGAATFLGPRRFTYLANFGSGVDYPADITSVPSYVSNIILEIKDSDPNENADYAVEFQCTGADGQESHGNFHSAGVNSSTFENNFVSVDFQFSEPNCDLSRYQIHRLAWFKGGQVIGQTPIQLRTQNTNAVSGYGIANDNGTILEDYETQVTIKSTPLTPRDPNAPCDNGYVQGGYSSFPIPTYSYGSDGLVEFHFEIQDDYTGNFYYRRMNPQFADCVSAGPIISAGHLFVNPLPVGTRLRLKAIPAGLDFFNQIVYNWAAFNDATNEPIPLDGTVANTTDGYVSVGFYYDTGCPYCNNFAVAAVFSPAVRLLRPTPPPTKTPVLIIPGVLGTDILKGNEKLWLDLGRNFTDVGDEFMDPLQFDHELSPSDSSLIIGDVIKNPITGQHFYDLILQEFINQGYQEGSSSDATLFTFPYDWRYGVSGILPGGNTVVDLLKQKIQDIMSQTGSSKVDVVAHSTGGLLVKKYVMDNPTDHHIRKAVFVGVPNTGSPKAVKVLLTGDGFGIPWLADGEMQKMAQNIPVVYDLSPSQKYYTSKGSYIKIIDQGPIFSKSKDLDFNEANNFLLNDHNSNVVALNNAHSLHSPEFDNLDLRTNGVDLYSINGCRTGTITKVIERRYTGLFGGVTISYDDPQESPGDGTVPLESATNLPIDNAHKYFALKADHGKMPSQDGIRQQIVNLISGSNLNVDGGLITQDIAKCKLKGKAISIFSPLDIQIIDQEGNTAGLVAGGVENNIPNADFEIMGEHKFVYLPDDEGQTYIVKLKGTGSGTFTLKDKDIDGDSILQTQIFSNLPVTTDLKGQVNLGAVTTLSLDTNGDGSVDQTVQPSAVINGEQSQDLIPPVSTSTVMGLMGEKGFYKGNATVTLTTLDPIITGHELETSGILNTHYSLDNQVYQIYTVPVSVTAEGQHTLKFYSTDKAGNNETEQSISFTIDKTVPEISVQFNSATKDFSFTATENLVPVCLATQCTAQDSAGNITVVKFEKATVLGTKNLVLKNISYNGQSQNFDPNLLSVVYTLSGSTITKLSQTELIKNQQILNIAYTQKQDQSVISDYTKGAKVQVSTVSGLKVLQISTNKGKIIISIK